ncbi:LysR family transcriptional regulator [Xanthomonas euroxanthea]|uniref:LysR family transcriptional regulator n=1 Tax=Xanthomonas euroxanthea TaxID=2259622 RepID=UPI0017D719D4|nr:LysR family transcriptional regulator [Xanthomonas euroxanthea]MBB5767391.1 DNA-binding transcriptional LysR family regulator [Xanthomonas euroxanthea]
MNNIDLRHLRYFLVLAHELHFTRAAQKIGIRQPPLSMQIQQLEDIVGARLFRRRSRGVELTAAGRSLQLSATEIFARLDAALADARRHGEGQAGQLRVGFAGATYFNPAIPAAIQAFRTRHPDVVLSPEQSNTPALLAGLRDNRLDVAFIRPPVDQDDRVTVRPFVDEEMVIAVPSGHPLDGETPLPLSATAGETLILFPRTIGTGLYDTVMAACRDAGFTPRLGQAASQIASIIPMVAAGFGVSVIPTSVSRIQNEGVTYRRIAGQTLHAPIALATRADDLSPLVSGFVAAVQLIQQAGSRTTA